MTSIFSPAGISITFCQSGGATIDLIQHEYDRARRDAALDWGNGTRRMYVQVIGAWGRFAHDLLSQRYSIQVEHVSDMTTATKLSYEHGYNSIARDYIAEQDGADAWDRIQEEIRNFRDAHYRKYMRKSDA